MEDRGFLLNLDALLSFGLQNPLTSRLRGSSGGQLIMHRTKMNKSRKFLSKDASKRPS